MGKRFKGAVTSVGLAALQAELSQAPRPEVGEEARRDVIERYARFGKSNLPEVCNPRANESDQRKKVIYNTLDAAKAAALELQELGSHPMEPYVCHRSKHGHVHLRTMR